MFSELASSELASHSMSIKEQMSNLIELEKKCKINIDKAKKNIGKQKSKFDPEVLLLKIMLCNVKIAQIDIDKTEQVACKVI
jgi:type II restriction/modification system DNA methylase subunit YeeA